MQEEMKDLVVFGAEWCNSCKAVKKMLDAEGCEYTYMDVDHPAAKALAKEGDVRGLPSAFWKGNPAFSNVPGCRSWLQRRGSTKVEPAPHLEPFQANPEGLAQLLEAARNAKPVRIRKEFVNPLQDIQNEVQVIFDDLNGEQAFPEAV